MLNARKDYLDEQTACEAICWLKYTTISELICTYEMAWAGPEGQQAQGCPLRVVG